MNINEFENLTGPVVIVPSPMKVEFVVVVNILFCIYAEETCNAEKDTSCQTKAQTSENKYVKGEETNGVKGRNDIENIFDFTSIGF